MELSTLLNKRPKKLGSGGGDKFGAGMPWVLCVKMLHGKKLVRGAPDMPELYWTFCPLKPHRGKLDYVKVCECEKCKHFKGYRKTFNNKIVQSLKEFGTPIRTFQRNQNLRNLQNPQKQEQKSRLRIQKPKRHKVRRTSRRLTEEDWMKIMKKKEDQDKKWQEEEENK